MRCSRDWPKCSRCIEKSLDCSYGDLIPVSFLKNDKLEEKIRESYRNLYLTVSGFHWSLM